MRLNIRAKAGRRTSASTYWLTTGFAGKQAHAEAGGNYVFNRIGYHVGFLTCGRTTSRRVDLVHTGPDLPETFQPRKIGDQHNVAVFYGKVDQKRDPGWYWTSVPGPGEPLKGPYNGPFKTKAEAVEGANQAAVIEEKGPG
jgi:hypothetical protein